MSRSNFRNTSTGSGTSATPGTPITAVQTRVKHPVLSFLAATLDGMVTETGAVSAKFMLPWSFSEAAAAEKYMAQLQHNMWVTNAKTAVLSIITGGGKWVEIAIAADPSTRPPAHRGEEILALCPVRGPVSPPRGGAAQAADRGGTGGRRRRSGFARVRVADIG
jgi:predicted phage-related endonuclease